MRRVSTRHGHQTNMWGSLKGISAAISAAVFMATIGVISRKTDVSAEWLTFFRLFLGALFMGVFLLVTGQYRRILQWPSWLVLVNGLMLAGFIVCYIQAMNFITMANAILLVYLAPVTAAILAHFLFHERLGHLSVVCISVAVFGITMVLEFKVDVAANAQYAKGLGFACLAMFAYTAFILINRRISSTVHPYASTFYQLLAGALVMTPFIISNQPTSLGEHWLWLAAAGIFPGFLAILFSVVALQSLRASTFGTLAYFEPLTVMIFGAVFFGEYLSSVQIGGCALIFVSGVVSALASDKSGDKFRHERFS